MIFRLSLFYRLKSESMKTCFRKPLGAKKHKRRVTLAANEVKSRFRAADINGLTRPGFNVRWSRYSLRECVQLAALLAKVLK